MLTEEHTTNVVFLMYFATENYKRKHNLTQEQFLAEDDAYGILHYIAECSDYFDCMNEDEMAEEIEEYVTARSQAVSRNHIPDSAC